MKIEKLKNKLGFGCMRLKKTNGQIDYDEFKRMIDAYMEAGFNYFDTSYVYLEGKSETALRDCLVSRYNREDYVLVDKLSDWVVEKEEEIVPLFEKQLEKCGVDYFDIYLFHSLTRKSYPRQKSLNCFEIVKKLKEQGKIKHIGLSFHDTADVLDTILTEQPCIEVVQLQINYMDYDDPGIQSKACYDVAVKHGKKVLVMEPIRGGYLANLPAEAAAVLDNLGGSSQASYALRYAASYPEVIMVLSGMGSMEMMQDNLNTFKNFVPFSKEEYEATDRVREIIRRVRQLPCTKCDYCVEVCPKKIPISSLFAVYNKHLSAQISARDAKELFPKDGAIAADCIKCGKCEGVCPQKIEIKTHLEKIAKMGG